MSWRRAATALARVLGAGLALWVLSLIFTPQQVAAAGETYTWKDYRTITVTGPDLKGPATLEIVDGANLSGDMSAQFNGRITYNKHAPLGCTVSVSLYLFKSSGDNGGRLWNPPPYGGTGIGQPGQALPCANFNDTSLDAALHDKWVNIAGKRPTNPNAPEKDAQKTFTVYVFAPDPLSKAPKTETITIYSADGSKVITKQTVPFVDDSGMADYPPDQTPVAAVATFKLEPGKYLVCDNYVAKKCTPATAAPEQKIEKIKYDGSGNTTLGKQFLTPEKRRINAHIEYHTKRPCGSILKVSPIAIELTKPDGTKVTKSTNGSESTPNPNEKGGLCTVNVILGLLAVFEDMPPGNYKACAPGAECVNFTKPEDDAGEVTLVIQEDLVAPPDQQVCTSGEGIAGALAWVICPVVEAVAQASDYFENHIIIPFMTVSPLTTNAKNPVYILWQAIRNIANFAFILFFFFIILSQATSRGVSNYGIKRLLPNIFLVVIGMNLSYFIVAVIIDAFNVFGAGISQLVMAALHQAGTTQLNDGTSAGPVRSIFVLGGAAVGAILLTGGSALGWLFGFIGLAALILLILVVVLVLRQLLIIMLTILSPLAILFALLPNTQQYFKRWYRLLLQLLLMYPMIVLLFAAGKIFGVMLQQPDFKLAGNGVSDDVAQAIRVILQFVVYIVPLALVPALFAASGNLMNRAYTMMQKNVIKPRTQRMKEDTSQALGEARLRMANRGIGGRGLRRDYVREQRRRNLEHEQGEYIAGIAGQSAWTRRRAAGVAGRAGEVRAAAAAAKAAVKARNEDIENEMAMLTAEMRRLGVDQQQFAEWTTDYMKNPNNPANVVRTGATGQSFDFSKEGSRLQRALLNSAAKQGEIGAIEAARLNQNIDQSMVDDIIRRNDGDLKGNGGYHLATQFDLAANRMQVIDPSTGEKRAAQNDQERQTEMEARRIIAMAQTGANSIVGMKYGLLMETAETLQAPTAHRDELRKAIDRISDAETRKARQKDPSAAAIDYRAMLRTQMNQIMSSRETVSRADVPPETFTNIRDGI